MLHTYGTMEQQVGIFKTSLAAAETVTRKDTRQF